MHWHPFHHARVTRRARSRWTTSIVVGVSAVFSLLALASPAQANGGGGYPSGEATCPSGNSAISSFSFTINGTRTVSHLGGQVRAGGTVTATFTLAKGCKNIGASLASYRAPAPTYDRNTADQQVLIDSATGTFSAGSHSFQVSVPPGCFQVDFVRGGVIAHLGPANSHNFYGDQSRLIDHDNGGSCPPPASYKLYIAYADTFRPLPGTNGGLPTFFEGSPGVIFVGCTAPTPQPVACPTDPDTGANLYDAGVIRLDNVGTAPFTVVPGTVIVGSCTFSPWIAATYTVPVGGTLMLTQTGGPPNCGELSGNYNFDTSEENESCIQPPTPTIPLINLTINGVPTTLRDSLQILNTGGVDQGICPGGNEFKDWTLIP